MTYNTENTLMETKNFTLPEMLEGDFSNEELADDYAGLQLSFSVSKSPAVVLSSLKFLAMTRKIPTMPKPSKGLSSTTTRQAHTGRKVRNTMTP